MTFSVAIPTYNRPEALSLCLKSILDQSLLPDEILIIDDGYLDNQFVDTLRDKVEKVLPSFVYYQKNQTLERRGLAESKNIALKKASGEIIFFLDDDLVLAQGFFKSIMKIWQEKQTDQKLIGVAGVISNNRWPGKVEKIYNQVFNLTSKKDWDITPVGFQVWNDQLDHVSEGHYAHGGVVSLRRVEASNFGFSVFGGGRTGLEDVDFCWRVKKRDFYFIIEPAARTDHYHSQETREKEYLSGQKESQNRIEIFGVQGEKGMKARGLFFWSMLGWVLRQFLAGHFTKGLGMLRGLFKGVLS